MPLSDVLRQAVKRHLIHHVDLRWQHDLVGSLEDTLVHLSSSAGRMIVEIQFPFDWFGVLLATTNFSILCRASAARQILACVAHQVRVHWLLLGVHAVGQ